MSQKPMTSRQRVTAAIRHQPVDRVPLDLGMHPSTGISAFAYRNLRKYLGLDCGRIEVTDPTQFLARVDEDVLRRFRIDCIQLHPGYAATRRWSPREGYSFLIPAAMRPVRAADGGWLATDGRGAGLKMPQNGYFFDGQGFDVWAEDGDSVLRRFAAEAERIYHETEYYTMFCGYGAYYMGDVEFCCELLIDEDAARERMEALHRGNLRHFDALAKACGEHIQGVCLGGDLGTQSGPMLSPKLYERLVHPLMKQFCRHIREASGYHIFMHSCGAVRDFIPYFIDEGIDVLNPVQISAAGMDPASLKAEFGSRIAFWGGGCDTQSVLNRGTPAQVKEHTRRMVEIFRQGSGFVFNQVHNIQGDVPPENVAAMLEAAYAGPAG